MYRKKKGILMGDLILNPSIERNYNYGNYERGTSGVTRVNPFAPVGEGGTGNYGQFANVNLESKCGTSNQYQPIPGHDVNYVARTLDFLG